MRPRLLELLVCPIDKTPLELIAWEQRDVALSADARAQARRMGLPASALGQEITTGVLVNRARHYYYPIYHGVPRLLAFPTGVARRFAAEYAPRLAAELPGFRLPAEQPMPGEEAVLRSFSSEWLHYDWRPGSYWKMTAEQMSRCMQFMLDLTRRPVRDKLVLEVGIGIGGVADYVVRQNRCELVGIDLSYAVDTAQKYFGDNPFLHIVQASVFAMPVRDGTFDLVYSHGVLHHTFSTKLALDRVAGLPKPGGRLYVWLYNPEEERRTWIRRALMTLERIIRPLCSRLPEALQTLLLLPIIPLYVVHQNILERRATPGAIRYGWREAAHAARDRFTPRFAHRQTEEEVAGWFRAAGYGGLQYASRRDWPSYVPAQFAGHTAVDGVRRALPAFRERDPTSESLLQPAPRA